MYNRCIETPIGYLNVASNGTAVINIQRVTEPIGNLPDSISVMASNQILDYFADNRVTFNIPLELTGTVFQKSVWNELAKIPFGESRTYGEIAKAIGKPSAVRAVGNAVGKNPVLIIIPCHRVLASNGIGGFSAGIDAKEILLSHEGIKF